MLFAEVERILARLWTLTQAARAAGGGRPERTALEQRESLFAALRKATGQRTFWAVAVPGGVRPTTSEGFDGLRGALRALDAGLGYWRAGVSPSGRIGAAGRGLGKLDAERVRALGLAGIVAGGAGLADDLRRTDRGDRYSGYGDLALKWPAPAPTRPPGGGAVVGDVAARLSFVVDDMARSIAITLECLTELEGADTAAVTYTPAQARSGREATATVEGPHGPVHVAVTLDAASRIEGLRLDTPCAATLAALSPLLAGQPMSLAPLLLASIDLCPECLDL